jgi:hypothetical protein
LGDTKLNWDGMKFPSGNRDFDRFEENSNDNVPVNVYSKFEFEGEETVVLHRITKVIGAKHHVNLLKTDDDKGKSHHACNKYCDALIVSQASKTTNKLHRCCYCQHGFKNQWLPDKHLERGCLAVEGQLPEKGNTISFKGHYRKVKCPFAIYCDFECLTTETCSRSQPTDPNKPYTYKYQQHKPSRYKIHVVSSIEDTVETHIYRGSDCMDVFLKKIREIVNNNMTILRTNNPMAMAERDEQYFRNATHCYVCGQQIEDIDHIQRGCKLRDHCHITGISRGCAHNVIHYNTIHHAMVQRSACCCNML